MTKALTPPHTTWLLAPIQYHLEWAQWWYDTRENTDRSDRLYRAARNLELADELMEAHENHTVEYPTLEQVEALAHLRLLVALAAALDTTRETGL